VRAARTFAFTLIALVAAGVLLRLPEAWWVPAVGAVALGGLAYRLVNWKCPACGERLPTRVTVAVASRTSPPITGARNATSS